MTVYDEFYAEKAEKRMRLWEERTSCCRGPGYHEAGVGYIASAVFLAIALRKLPLGTAYAMWTGMGILGTTLLGVFLFHEKLSVPQVICVILIVIGIAGLKILAKD